MGGLPLHFRQLGAGAAAVRVAGDRRRESDRDAGRVPRIGRGELQLVPRAREPADPRGGPWREPFLSYFATAGASNCGTEAMKGLIELHRRGRQRLQKPRQLQATNALIGGGLTQPRIR